MFNIGFSEMLMIGVLALILIGPKQLPEVARTLGRFLNELKRSSENLKDDLGISRIQDDVRKGVDKFLEEKNQLSRQTSETFDIEKPQSPGTAIEKDEIPSGKMKSDS